MVQLEPWFEFKGERVCVGVVGPRTPLYHAHSARGSSERNETPKQFLVPVLHRDRSRRRWPNGKPVMFPSRKELEGDGYSVHAAILWPER